MFDGVTAVLFLASLSEFDEKLFEDSNQRAIDEAFEVFEARKK